MLIIKLIFAYLFFSVFFHSSLHCHRYENIPAYFWSKPPNKYLSVYIFLVFFFILIFYCYWITVVPIFPPLPALPDTSLPSSNPPVSSCPWIVHISSLASPFPRLFLSSPCLFCTYHLCFLFPSSPFPSPLRTLHVTSISVNLFLF